LNNKGKLIYICSDPENFVFKYKNKNGFVQVDMDSKELFKYVSKAGLFKDGINIRNEWYIDDEGNTDINKFLVLLDKKENICKIKDDETFFKKELASLIKI